MADSKSGSCQCGAISYLVEGDPLLTYACHCHDCQKRTGSAFSMGVVYPTPALKLEGELSTWERQSDDGNTNTRFSCRKCGNVIYGVSTHSPELMKLQAGTLDDTQKIRPDAHIWTRRAQAWVAIPPEDPSYETQPENLMDIFTAVKARADSDQKYS